MTFDHGLTLSYDYFVFIHGFSFVLLGSAAYLLRSRLSSRLKWVSAFAILYALSIWMGLLRLALDLPTGSCRINIALQVLAFGALLRYLHPFSKARAEWLAYLVLLLVPALISSILSWVQVGFVIRALFLLPMTILGSLRGYRWTRSFPETRVPVLIGCIIYLFYVLITIHPSYGHPHTLTADFPQITTALLSLAGSLCFWWLHYHYRKDFRPMQKVLVWMGMILMLGYYITEQAGTIAERLHLQKDQESIQLVESTLLGAIDDAFRTAEMAGTHSEIIAALRSPRVSPETQTILQRYATLCMGCIVYLVNSSGDVIVSSEASSERENFRDRAYFIKAMAVGSKPAWFDPGRVDHEPGVMALVPLRDEFQRTMGVLIVKIRLNRLNLLSYITGESFFVNPDGAILLAKSAHLANRALWPIPSHRVAELLTKQEFLTLDPSPILNTVPGEESKQVWNNKIYHVLRHKNINDWSFVFFLSETWVTYFRLGAIGIVFLICILLVVAFMSHEQQEDAKISVANSEKQYRSIFEQSGLVTLIVDPATGAILDANEAATQFYGYPRQELRNKNIWDISLSERAEILRRVALTANKRTQHLEARHRRADGSIRDVEIYESEMPFKEKTALYCVVQDVSERRKVELEKKAVLEQLIQSSKLASIGTLAAGVAHEINNPLTVIKGLNSILREQLLPLNQSERCLANIDKNDRAVDRITAIVNGLRTYARAGNDELEIVQVHKIIDETLSLIGTVYKKNSVQLTVDLKSKRPLVLANSGKLQQVLVNFLSNAIDAIEGNEGEKRIDLRTFDRDGRIHIQVGDNGCGISAEVLTRIWDPFFTTKPPGKGTGLGLSISRSIVESFRGTISIESKAGHGALFDISFPIASDSFVEAKEAPAKSDYQFEGRALIVDDEPDIRAILRNYLTSFGMKVDEAENGIEALQRLKESSYKLAVVDLQMPVMSGSELLIELARIPERIDTRILVVTGGIIADQPSDLRQQFARIARGYLRKPFSREDIGEALAAVLSE